MLPEHLNGHSRAGVAPYPCWIEVDLDAITANVRALKQLVGSSTAIAAVVKADGYGLGAERVARVALAAGAEWLAVARVEEGAELRRSGVTAPILNLAYMAPDEIKTAVRYGITPTVVDVRTAEALASFVPAGASFPVHVKLDTGLSRFGVQRNELDRLLDCLKRLGKLHLEGLYSHLATADEPDLSFARQQIQRFGAAEATVEAQGFRPRLRHLANSAATLALPETRQDLVRPGITLSGHYPSPEMPRTVDLQPAVSLKARLARVYDLPAGASVGYGRTYITDRDILAAVVPVGYADGLPRSHSNHGEVLLRGRRVRLIGRISMDQCVADVSPVPEAQPGDEVVLIGEQGGARIDLWEYATWGDTIAHEALCQLGPRVPRCYVADGAIRDIGWIGHRTVGSVDSEESIAKSISAPDRLARSARPYRAEALPATSPDRRTL